jgi:hypothetical protein
MEMDYCCPEEKLRPATRRESVVRPISDAVDARARHENSNLSFEFCTHQIKI